MKSDLALFAAIFTGAMVLYLVQLAINAVAPAEVGGKMPFYFWLCAALGAGVAAMLIVRLVEWCSERYGKPANLD